MDAVLLTCGPKSGESGVREIRAGAPGANESGACSRGRRTLDEEDMMVEIQVARAPGLLVSLFFSPPDVVMIFAQGREGIPLYIHAGRPMEP